MAKRQSQEPAPGPLRCSFCGWSEDQVRKLIAGPLVSICAGCIACCVDILAEEDARDAREEPSARHQDADPDAMLAGMTGEGLADLLEKQLKLHAELDPTLRAAIWGAVSRLGKRGG
jgi:hypothetical protein